eukprot:8324305-Alexandrium_andersonii.AAC.1
MTTWFQNSTLEECAVVASAGDGGRSLRSSPVLAPEVALWGCSTQAWPVGAGPGVQSSEEWAFG